MHVTYLPKFIKKFNTLPQQLQDEVVEKIELFKDSKNHESLRVHKLHGRFKDCYSFSVNYKYRIIFTWTSDTEASLLAIGDHSIYE